MTTQQKQRLQYLLLQYMEGDASAAQRQELSGLLEQEKEDAEWHELMEEIFAAETPLENYREQDWQPMIEDLIKQNRKSSKVIPMWKRIAVAASILLVLGLGSYFLFFKRGTSPSSGSELTQQERFKNEVEPGGYKAKLTLADGRIIVLDSAETGELAKQGTTSVTNKNGQLLYDVQGNATEVLFNTLITAKGETYATVLADGSKVWLNSASSIKFPVAFVGGERKVEITGEAYFEVAKDASKPFHVTVSGIDVAVLGTHFNMNAYDDEASMKVTLLEGSVKASMVNGEWSILKPGDQAQLSKSIKVVKGVDVDAVMAWKEGLFNFNNSDLEIVMRQLARWYDVEIVYQGSIPKRNFGGEMQRDLNLSEVLKVLETNQIHFKIEGKKLIVLQ